MLWLSGGELPHRRSEQPLERDLVIVRRHLADRYLAAQPFGAGPAQLGTLELGDRRLVLVPRRKVRPAGRSNTNIAPGSCRPSLLMMKPRTRASKQLRCASRLLSMYVSNQLAEILEQRALDAIDEIAHLLGIGARQALFENLVIAFHDRDEARQQLHFGAVEPLDPGAMKPRCELVILAGQARHRRGQLRGLGQAQLGQLGQLLALLAALGHRDGNERHRRLAAQPERFLEGRRCPHHEHAAHLGQQLVSTLP